MDNELVEVKYNCSMKYSVLLGPGVTQFKEHPICDGSGKFQVSKRKWEKNLNLQNHNLIFVRCKKCGQELNLQSGNMEIV